MTIFRTSLRTLTVVVCLAGCGVISTTAAHAGVAESLDPTPICAVPPITTPLNVEEEEGLFTGCLAADEEIPSALQQQRTAYVEAKGQFKINGGKFHVESIASANAFITVDQKSLVQSNGVPDLGYLASVTFVPNGTSKAEIDGEADVDFIFFVERKVKVRFTAIYDDTKPVGQKLTGTITRR